MNAKLMYKMMPNFCASLLSVMTRHGSNRKNGKSVKEVTTESSCLTFFYIKKNPIYFIKVLELLSFCYRNESLFNIYEILLQNNS